MKLTAKDMALVGLFAALTAVCAWISIPLPGLVPITLQTFAVFLTAGVLGARRGTLAVLVYILLGVVGLPVFAGFKTLNPVTFGYVVGFLPLGLCTAGVEKLCPRARIAKPLGMLLGLLLCYAIGTVWFYFARGRGSTFWDVLGWCVFPFIVPDVIKLGLGWLLSEKLKKIVR